MYSILRSTSTRNNKIIRNFSSSNASAAVKLVRPTKQDEIQVLTLSGLGLNQSISFSNVVESDGSIIIKHKVEDIPFLPTSLTKRPFNHNLTPEQVEEIQKLRPTMSQKQLAEKFNTSKYIIGRVSRCSPETRQKLIDNFQIKTPKQFVSEDVKKSRLSLWLQKNTQREYDMKVLKAAKAYETIKSFRTAKNLYNFEANQETYDILNGIPVGDKDKYAPLSQSSKKSSSDPQTIQQQQQQKQQDDQPKKKFEGRRRRNVSEKEKSDEQSRRLKNKIEKRKENKASRQNQ
eukprot:gene2612-3237_t